MGIKFDVHVKGLNEIDAKLKALPEKLRRKAIREALRRGTDLVRDEAILRAPRGDKLEGFGENSSGNDHLKDNIVSKIKVKAGYSWARVGTDWDRVRYGHLVEFGHRVVVRRRDTGFKTRKFPFMRPAFDLKGEEALEVITTDLAKAVEEEI